MPSFSRTLYLVAIILAVDITWSFPQDYYDDQGGQTTGGVQEHFTGAMQTDGDAPEENNQGGGGEQGMTQEGAVVEGIGDNSGETSTDNEETNAAECSQESDRGKACTAPCPETHNCLCTTPPDAYCSSGPCLYQTCLPNQNFFPPPDMMSPDFTSFNPGGPDFSLYGPGNSEFSPFNPGPLDFPPFNPGFK